MKTIIGALMVVGVVGVIVIGLLNEQGTVEAVNPKVEKEVVEVQPEEVDVVEAAKAELDRINIELHEEETRLLSEKEAVEAQAAAEVAEIEARLEQIRETRTSFQ